LYRAGELLGKECVAKGAHCWLGPTVNIQRSPLGGRGFESYSEDPHLSGILAVQAVQGCESTGVQATPKHFVCNDQEHERRSVDTIVMERALREVYLRPFQIMARDAKPGCLMTSYNKVNGVHVAEDERLLEQVVRKEWGWDPVMISDWYVFRDPNRRIFADLFRFGTQSTVAAINAGLDIEMPGKTKYRGALGEFALGSRLIKQSVLDKRVRRVLEFVQRASQLEVAAVEGIRDLAEDRQLNRELCGSSIVLMKNESNLLPLPKTIKKIALIGSHMKLPSLSGGGSASLEPYYCVSPFEAITAKLDPSTEITYEVGVYAHKMLPVMSGQLKTRDGRGATGGTLTFYNDHPSITTRTPVATLHVAQTNIQLMDYKNPDLNISLFYATFEASLSPDTTGIWDFSLSVYGTANLYIDGELVIDETSGPQEGGSNFFGKGTKEKFGSRELVAGKEYIITVEFGRRPKSRVWVLLDLAVVLFAWAVVHVSRIKQRRLRRQLKRLLRPNMPCCVQV